MSNKYKIIWLKRTNNYKSKNILSKNCFKIKNSNNLTRIKVNSEFTQEATVVSTGTIRKSRQISLHQFYMSLCHQKYKILFGITWWSEVNRSILGDPHRELVHLAQQIGRKFLKDKGRMSWIKKIILFKFLLTFLFGVKSHLFLAFSREFLVSSRRYSKISLSAPSRSLDK